MIEEAFDARAGREVGLSVMRAAQRHVSRISSFLVISLYILTVTNHLIHQIRSRYLDSRLSRMKAG